MCERCDEEGDRETPGRATMLDHGSLPVYGMPGRFRLRAARYGGQVASRPTCVDCECLLPLLTDRLPELGLRLRRGRRVDVDVAFKVEIQLLQDGHERLHVIVGRLARVHREVALE